jgi:hypothetical protein
VAKSLLRMSGLEEFYGSSWKAPGLDSAGTIRQGAAMAARIYQRAKNAMQSGKARAGQWVLEFESARAKRPDPLTGWSGGAETVEQVVLTFPTLEAAQAYAMREGIDAHVVPGAQAKLKLQAYADNFR